MLLFLELNLNSYLLKGTIVQINFFKYLMKGNLVTFVNNRRKPQNANLEIQW